MQPPPAGALIPDRRGGTAGTVRPSRSAACSSGSPLPSPGYTPTGGPQPQRASTPTSSTAGALAGEANRLRDAALPSDGAVRSQLDRDELLAGVTAVTGPGMVVRLADPPRTTPAAVVGRPGTTPLADTAVLTDRDVRAVVNELWHDGAEAISVNDVRLTPTTAIRFAGQAVLVDFRPVTSPYTIRAI